MGTPNINITIDGGWKYNVCVACLDAVSPYKGLIHYKVRLKSFKTPNFIAFLTDLKHKLGAGWHTVLLDNCNVHRAHETTKLSASIGIDLLWNVPYRPDLNGIEMVWGMAKASYRSIML